MRNIFILLDETFIRASRRIFEPVARIALFVIYFWFGSLKVFADSGINVLTEPLQAMLLPGISFSDFNIVFGLIEMAIGVMILIPRLERVVVVVSLLHIISTILPLFLLKDLTWNGAFRPNLLGQYILKNLLIIALTIGLAGRIMSLRSAEEERRRARQRSFPADA